MASPSGASSVSPSGASSPSSKTPPPSSVSSLLAAHAFTILLASVGTLAGIAINSMLLSAIDFAEENHPYRAVKYKTVYVIVAVALAVAFSVFVYSKYHTRDPASSALHPQSV